MPRKLRVEYPGAVYHVMSRGDRREDIYLDDVDRQDFIKTLAEAYALLRSDPLNFVDPNGLKKCGIRWMKVEWSNFHTFMLGDADHPLPPSAPTWQRNRGGMIWHVDEEVKFRNDGDYAPCCCEVQRVVSHTATPINPATVPDSDNVSRASNDADPGYPDTFDCNRQYFHDEDNPLEVLDRGNQLDYSFTSTFSVLGTGKPYGGNKAKGIPPCDCEEQGLVASIEHTVHVTGTFPDKLDLNDSIPVWLLTAFLP